MGAYTPIGLLLGERYIDDPEGLDSFYPKSHGMYFTKVWP